MFLFRVKFSLFPIALKSLCSPNPCNAIPRVAEVFDFVRNWSRDGDRLPVRFKKELAVLVTTHNSYTSGTQDSPFRVEAMPTFPSSAFLSDVHR